MKKNVQINIKYTRIFLCIYMAYVNIEHTYTIYNVYSISILI